MSRLIIVGPPGAGKGTQGKRVAERLNIPAISTGDIFRSNIKNKTELGRKVEAIISAGQYVPDELTNELVADRIAQPDAAAGFLLDGYPRTKGQVGSLDAMLEKAGHSIDAVLQLTVDTTEVVQRLLARAETEGRADDTEEVIRERLAVYERETAPLVAMYELRNLVVRVDGLGEIDDVTARLVKALDEHTAGV